VLVQRSLRRLTRMQPQWAGTTALPVMELQGELREVFWPKVS